MSLLTLIYIEYCPPLIIWNHYSAEEELYLSEGTFGAAETEASSVIWLPEPSTFLLLIAQNPESPNCLCPVLGLHTLLPLPSSFRDLPSLLREGFGFPFSKEEKP